MDPGAIEQERAWEAHMRLLREVENNLDEMPVQTVVPSVPTRIRLEGQDGWSLLLAVVVRVRATRLGYQPPDEYGGSLHRTDLIYVTIDGGHFDDYDEVWFQILVGDEWCDV